MEARRWRRICGTLILPLLLPSLQAQSPAPREHAGYVLPDGTVQVITCSAMAGVIQALNMIYVAKHPGTKFSVREGDNYSSMAALTFDRTAFAPLGTEFTRIGLGDNLKIAAEPVGFRIAHASMSPGPGVPALGVIINAANPLTSLSMSELVRMFTVGPPMGDISVWGQARVKGPLSSRAIEPVGPMASDYLASDDPQAGEFLSTSIMGGLNMAHSYVAMTNYVDVVQRINENPAAIGIVALNVPLGGARVLQLKGTETGTAVAPTAQAIGEGRYPLDRYVYIYLRVGKGIPIDEFGKAYVRMALSDDGQHAIGSEASGYIPLSAGERAEELAKLEH